MDNNDVIDFQKAVKKELTENLIPFWVQHSLDHEHGGFIGRMTQDFKIESGAPKGLILNSRILWTFSALYQWQQKPVFLEMAQRAYEYLLEFFHDSENGGYFWMLDAKGNALDRIKKVYGQAFVIYAFSEFARAAHRPDAAQHAKELFNLMEDKCRDKTYNGYFENFNPDWSLADDCRLSEKDMDEKKSMNSHLHIMEAYTNLYRDCREEPVRQALHTLIGIFQNHIIHRKRHCFMLFFDETWQHKTDLISFGHDIEGSWLLIESAEVLGDDSMLARQKDISLKMVEAVIERGLYKDGSLFYEGTVNDIVDSDRHWWPQAEAVVGFINAYQLSDDDQYLDKALRCWQFIENFIVDNKHGEWVWRVSKDGSLYTNEYKVSEWKSPYHGIRACLEIMNRLDMINLAEGEEHLR